MALPRASIACASRPCATEEIGSRSARRRLRQRRVAVRHAQLQALQLRTFLDTFEASPASALSAEAREFVPADVQVCGQVDAVLSYLDPSAGHVTRGSVSQNDNSCVVNSKRREMREPHVADSLIACRWSFVCGSVLLCPTSIPTL